MNLIPSEKSLDRPRISVVMCTFNGEKYLGEQLDSILTQSRKVDEIIIADDVSTDSTTSLLSDYSDKNLGLLKLFFNKQNLGTIDNFAFALQKASGDIIFFCDQDDIWHKHKVENMLKQFVRKRCLLLFTNGNIVDSTRQEMGMNLFHRFKFSKIRQFLWRFFPSFSLYDLLNNNNKVTGATVAIRKELLSKALPIQPLPDGYWHDVWFAMHAAANGGLVFMRETCIDYRIHPQQQVGIKTEIGSHKRPTIPVAQLMKNFEALYPVQSRRVRRIQRLQKFRQRLKTTPLDDCVH